MNLAFLYSDTLEFRLIHHTPVPNITMRLAIALTSSLIVLTACTATPVDDDSMSSASSVAFSSSSTSSEAENRITLDYPVANQVVTSPLTISGSAIGPWYFEASFPVELLDANGMILTQVPAQAQGEWMTTDFVPFSATLTFTTPATSTGTLVLKKDNPSGLPENDASISIPISF